MKAELAIGKVSHFELRKEFIKYCELKIDSIKLYEAIYNADYDSYAVEPEIGGTRLFLLVKTANESELVKVASWHVTQDGISYIW